MSMKRLISQDRDQLARKCHLYIPIELVYEAETWQIDINELARSGSFGYMLKSVPSIIT